MTDQKIAEYLLSLLENGGGTVAKATVADKLPFLKDEDIARIFAEYVPDVNETSVAGIPCWQRIRLPVDFAEHIKETTAKLEEMGFVVSPDNLNLALSIRYGKNFRVSYGLKDNGAFKKFLKRFSTKSEDNRTTSNVETDLMKRARKAEVVLFGKTYSFNSAQTATTFIFNELAKSDPSFLDKCSKHPKISGQKRQYLTRSLDAMYPGRKYLFDRHAKLPDGWLLCTCTNNEIKIKIINIAAEIANLTIGNDLIVNFKMEDTVND